jgi:hypothetical protein
MSLQVLLRCAWPAKHPDVLTSRSQLIRWIPRASTSSSGGRAKTTSTRSVRAAALMTSQSISHASGALKSSSTASSAAFSSVGSQVAPGAVATSKSARPLPSSCCRAPSQRSGDYWMARVRCAVLARSGCDPPSTLPALLWPCRGDPRSALRRRREVGPGDHPPAARGFCNGGSGSVRGGPSMCCSSLRASEVADKDGCRAELRSGGRLRRSLSSRRSFARSARDLISDVWDRLDGGGVPELSP